MDVLEHRNDPIAAIINGQPAATEPDIEIEQDDTFSYDGYQVVRGEFFAHIYEPSITFNRCKVSLNTACIRKLPNVDYVQILVNPDTLKLAVRPVRRMKRTHSSGAPKRMANGRPSRLPAAWSSPKSST